MVVGVSNLCTDFKYLREAYDEARAAVRAAFLLGYGRVIFYRDLSQKPFVPSQDMQRELYDRILANDFTQATNFLNSYIDRLSACREQDIPQIREALASIAYWLSRQGKQNEQDGSQYISEFIHFAPSLAVVHDYLLHSCKSTSTASRTSITKVASCSKWSNISRKITIRNSPFVRSPSAFS